jgi:hypothetical protein
MMRAKRLRQQRLARTGGPDQQDVRLGKLHVLILLGVVQALVVIVDCHGQDALGALLADDVIVEDLADLGRGRHAIGRLDHRGLVLLADDVHAQFDAFIADEHGWTGDQFANLVLGLAAERAIERVLRRLARGGFFGHRLHSWRRPSPPYPASAETLTRET